MQRRMKNRQKINGNQAFLMSQENIIYAKIQTLVEDLHFDEIINILANIYQEKEECDDEMNSKVCNMNISFFYFPSAF